MIESPIMKATTGLRRPRSAMVRHCAAASGMPAPTCHGHEHRRPMEVLARRSPMEPRTTLRTLTRREADQEPGGMQELFRNGPLCPYENSHGSESTGVTSHFLRTDAPAASQTEADRRTRYESCAYFGVYLTGSCSTPAELLEDTERPRTQG